MKNKTLWTDTEGKPIQAHGGMILQHKGIYYWYGENKDTETVNRHVDFIGISCYSSEDLENWRNEGIVLSPVVNNPAHMLYTKNICERPRVLYNKSTKQFVMYTHADTADYYYAGVNVAVAASPTGPFVWLKSFQPNWQDSRDMTLFQDLDGSAWLIHSANYNKTMNIARLSDDYLDVTGSYISIFQDQEREAPAIMYSHNRYYMITSGCSGWEPNPSLYGICDHLIGPWKLIDNPCTGPAYRTTFDGQGTCIFFVQNQPYVLLDHWHPDDLRSSAYSMLPIQILDNGGLKIEWQDETFFTNSKRREGTS